MLLLSVPVELGKGFGTVPVLFGSVVLASMYLLAFAQPSLQLYLLVSPKIRE